MIRMILRAVVLVAGRPLLKVALFVLLVFVLGTASDLVLDALALRPAQSSSSQ